MSDVIEFLEKLGSDARSRGAPRNQIDQSLEKAGIDATIRLALLSDNQRILEDLLGANIHICCLIRAPDEEPEEQDDDDGEEDQPAEDDEVRSTAMMLPATSLRSGIET